MLDGIKNHLHHWMTTKNHLYQSMMTQKKWQLKNNNHSTSNHEQNCSPPLDVDQIDLYGWHYILLDNHDIIIIAHKWLHLLVIGYFTFFLLIVRTYHMQSHFLNVISFSQLCELHHFQMSHNSNLYNAQFQGIKNSPKLDICFSFFKTRIQFFFEVRVNLLGKQATTNCQVCMIFEIFEMTFVSMSNALLYKMNFWNQNACLSCNCQFSIDHFLSTIHTNVFMFIKEIMEIYCLKMCKILNLYQIPVINIWLLYSISPNSSSM